MNYNTHPLFVHFPIALLFVYSVITILPFQRWFPSIAWKQIGRVLLVVGVLGAFASLATGETAEHLVRTNRQIVEIHSFFATLATWMYGLLLGGEALSIINPYLRSRQFNSGILHISQWIEKILNNRVLVVLLAIVGLIAISITGLLGGVLVYGATADPLAPIVLKVLGISV